MPETTSVEKLQQDIAEMRKELDTLKSNYGGKPTKPKKPRAPTAFNIFMKQEIPLVKAENPGIKHSDAFKVAAGRWKDKKDIVE